VQVIDLTIDLYGVMRKCEAVMIIEGHARRVCGKCRSRFLPPYWAL